MDKSPAVGDHVRFAGNSIIGPCTGVVTSIYRTRVYAEDVDWDSDEWVRPVGHKPEREWQVAVMVDELPTPWPYPNSIRFSATVADLDAIDSS